MWPSWRHASGSMGGWRAIGKRRRSRQRSAPRRRRPVGASGWARPRSRCAVGSVAAGWAISSAGRGRAPRSGCGSPSVSSSADRSGWSSAGRSGPTRPMPATSRSRSSSCAWAGAPGMAAGSRCRPGRPTRPARPMSACATMRAGRSSWSSAGTRSAMSGPPHERRAGSSPRPRPSRSPRAASDRSPFAGVWVVRAAARNRALVARYPEVFAARFPGSSARWVAALTHGTEPPPEPGLVWCDVGATRLFAWRRRA